MIAIVKKKMASARRFCLCSFIAWNPLDQFFVLDLVDLSLDQITDPLADGCSLRDFEEPDVVLVIEEDVNQTTLAFRGL